MTVRLPRPLSADVSCEGLSRQVRGWPSKVFSREETLKVWEGPSDPRTQARWPSRPLAWAAALLSLRPHPTCR